jgi:hypothetical protein
VRAIGSSSGGSADSAVVDRLAATADDAANGDQECEDANARVHDASRSREGCLLSPGSLFTERAILSSARTLDVVLVVGELRRRTGCVGAASGPASRLLTNFGALGCAQTYRRLACETAVDAPGARANECALPSLK